MPSFIVGSACLLCCRKPKLNRCRPFYFIILLHHSKFMYKCGCVCIWVAAWVWVRAWVCVEIGYLKNSSTHTVIDTQRSYTSYYTPDRGYHLHTVCAGVRPRAIVSGFGMYSVCRQHIIHQYKEFSLPATYNEQLCMSVDTITGVRGFL